MLKQTFSLILLAALTPSVFADVVTYNTTAGPIAIGASGSVNLPQFDASLGILRQVRVRVFAEVSGSWAFENTASFPDGVGGYASSEYVGALVPVSLPNGGGMPPPNPAFLLDPQVPLTAFDGATDFSGTSGATVAFANESGDGAPSQYSDIYQDAALPHYVGASSFVVGLGPIGPVGPYLPAHIQSTVTMTVNAFITVVYTYDPLPARICQAASFSGCPCGNFSFGPNGCANSLGTSGGSLGASGTASLSSDTLSLHGAGMTNSSALYFQGTTFSYAQSVYGDGLRCVTGTIARLGNKTNAGGASQYPQAGDVPISVRGHVTAPGTRYYQVVYRDGGAFCTAAQINTSNGMAILWAP